MIGDLTDPLCRTRYPVHFACNARTLAQIEDAVVGDRYRAGPSAFAEMAEQYARLYSPACARWPVAAIRFRGVGVYRDDALPNDLVVRRDGLRPPNPSRGQRRCEERP